MDHVVYLDAKVGEMENLLSGKKNMIIRGAMGRKLPYGRVNIEDVLYFINNNAEGEVKARATVSCVLNSEKLTPEASGELLKKYHNQLQLTDEQYKRWAGKRYVVLIEVKDVQKITPFRIDKSDYGNMDDWLLVEQIKKVRIN